MSRAAIVLRELLGLFIEDPILGVGIGVWLVIDGLLLPELGLDPRWVALALFFGCAAILIATTALAARRAALTSGRWRWGSRRIYSTNRDPVE